MKKSGIFRLVAGIVAGAAILGGASAYAASETDTAVAYLVNQGIYAGDENGNLMLDKSLTRAELTVILTRLDFADAPGGLAEWSEWGSAHFGDPANRYNTFTDLPQWAAPYIEYCYQRSLMVGIGDNKFDPNSTVSPKQVCTVILRYCGVPTTDWGYDTAIAKAKALGLTPEMGIDGDVILRDTMAVVIYRGINYKPSGETVSDAPSSQTPSQPTTPASDNATAMTIDEMKAEIVRLTNIERVNASVPELTALPELMNSAQAKAQDFLDNHYFGHNSPKYGTPGEMIKSYVPKAKSAAENLSGWAKTPTEAFNAITDSTEHYGIMVNNKYTHIGIGIVEGADGGYWWVQHFAAL
ncbi:MAG: CAP domain-containing protein [Oscillospiraceae bacterium]|jgi:uncharacterized protein YkwD|nr:CAP domain-containing protein [Oscillospiraceae bacterium]